MNWFTRGAATKVGEFDDVCEHVEQDESLAAFYSQENDSFGIVDRYVMCKECSDAQEKALEEELVGCRDCGIQKPAKEITAWRWYDFYAPQGDEAVNVCDACWKQPKHIERMEDDARSRAWELGEDLDEEDYEEDYDTDPGVDGFMEEELDEDYDEIEDFIGLMSCNGYEWEFVSIDGLVVYASFGMDESNVRFFDSEKNASIIKVINDNELKKHLTNIDVAIKEGQRDIRELAKLI